MMLNQDKVPITLDEAVAIIKEGMNKRDHATLLEPTFTPVQLHFTVGTVIRNSWSLWDKETVLVRWFKQTYGLEHADDISGLIFDCLHRDCIGKPRREMEMVQKFLDHWKNQK